MKKKAWWIIAREEGRLCRCCQQPMSKEEWKNKSLDGLCSFCWEREMNLPHNSSFRLTRESEVVQKQD